MLYKTKYKKKSAGFTMIEVVIALFVLTVAVIGVYNAFSIMAVATAQMSDRFTAAYLAQEGIEIIRNMRDNNWLKDPQVDWTAGLLCGSPPCHWQADYTTGTSAPGAFPLQDWSGNDETGGSHLNINSNSFYYYDLSNPNETKFRRKITIDSVRNSANETVALKVSATVFWEEKPNIVNIDFPAQPGSITAEDYLYNWY